MADQLSKPVGIVGAGPIGLITALGLAHYGIPAVVFEKGSSLSTETKAGTVLTRTLEVLDRYNALEDVLAASLRIDEIGELDRASDRTSGGVSTAALGDDSRFPFVINIPQHELEAVLYRRLEQLAPGTVRFNCGVEDFLQSDDHVEVRLRTQDGIRTQQVEYLLGCDGGRSTVRDRLGIPVQGQTLEQRYMVVDLLCDLDVANPRDYPYLAYFGDPDEWMILVRQPHCWRFLFPLEPGAPEPIDAELLTKARRFIGEVDEIELVGTNVYTVHHRVATRWRDRRVFLMGDAAHLITPMWALGLNTGVLDASNLPWRLAWVHRGWADPGLLGGYETEQAPVAIQGSGEMAEAARAVMSRRAGKLTGMGGGAWGDAVTRTLTGVRLDVDGSGDWSMIRTASQPTAVRPGDRIPDLVLIDTRGRTSLHQLVANSFVAFHFVDARRRPELPEVNPPGLTQFVVSRWDAPHDSGLRERALFDPGDRVRNRLGFDRDAVVLVRPDGHIAVLQDWSADAGTHLVQRYLTIVRPTETEPAAGRQIQQKEPAHGRR